MSARAEIRYAFPVTEEGKKRLGVFEKKDLNNIVDMIDSCVHPEIFEKLMIECNFIRPHTVAFVESENLTINQPIVADVRLFYSFVAEGVEQVHYNCEESAKKLREHLRTVPHVLLRPSE